jgi:hypothetical protein
MDVSPRGFLADRFARSRVVAGGLDCDPQCWTGSATVVHASSGSFGRANTLAIILPDEANMLNLKEIDAESGCEWD